MTYFFQCSFGILCARLPRIQGYLECSAWRRATMSKGDRELERLISCCSSERHYYCWSPTSETITDICAVYKKRRNYYIDYILYTPATHTCNILLTVLSKSLSVISVKVTPTGSPNSTLLLRIVLSLTPNILAIML